MQFSPPLSPSLAIPRALSRSLALSLSLSPACVRALLLLCVCLSPLLSAFCFLLSAIALLHSRSLCVCRWLRKSIQIKCGLNVKINKNVCLCWIGDVFCPQHHWCWDKIAKHISNPDVATSYFDYCTMCGWLAWSGTAGANSWTTLLPSRITTYTKRCNCDLLSLSLVQYTAAGPTRPAIPVFGAVHGSRAHTTAEPTRF